jgi:hypothetical protein
LTVFNSTVRILFIYLFIYLHGNRVLPVLACVRCNVTYKSAEHVTDETDIIRSLSDRVQGRTHALAIERDLDQFEAVSKSLCPHRARFQVSLMLKVVKVQFE